jgi:hypothetical protein
MGFWLRAGNLWASRRKVFRVDRSNTWRYQFHGAPAATPDRSVPFSALIDRPVTAQGFRFVILGDTGEGDRSQYGLLPVIRSLQPDFLVINGDVAYPAGSTEDFRQGFFEPYRDLDLPIWAVPGNHEYYAPNGGQEFYDVFCTRRIATLWSEYGLRLVPQPGTYWELREPDPAIPLVVLGVDTGQKADLDGQTPEAGDGRQLAWLDQRLGVADAEGRVAIVLFHIPALVREKPAKVRLRGLHTILASHPSVRLVLCAHEHNVQMYDAGTFETFLRDVYGVARRPFGSPSYVVAGSSGATLGHTDFQGGPYPAAVRYPDPGQWTRYARLGRKAVIAAGLSENVLSRLVGLFEKSALSDWDAAQYLSMIEVEVPPPPAPVRVTPIFLDDLEALFMHLPPGSVVDVRDPNPPVDHNAVLACRRPGLTL